MSRMTTVKIENRTKKAVKPSQSQVKNIVVSALEQLAPDLTCKQEIEILFVESDEIKKLNKKYRKIDKTTDVLSFPQSQMMGNPLNILGSIVICLEIVEQKEEALENVLKHGLLHLLGYDHETNSKRWENAADKINCQL